MTFKRNDDPLVCVERGGLEKLGARTLRASMPPTTDRNVEAANGRESFSAQFHATE
jgi:hypothetical protein